MNTMDSAPQQDLILRASAGDQHAFEALLLPHRAKLRSVIRCMVGHADDTDDLVQEAMIHAWRAIGSFRGEASFSTWLCSIIFRRKIQSVKSPACRASEMWQFF